MNSSGLPSMCSTYPIISKKDLSFSRIRLAYIHIHSRQVVDVYTVEEKDPPTTFFVFLSVSVLSRGYDFNNHACFIRNEQSPEMYRTFYCTMHVPVTACGIIHHPFIIHAFIYPA